MLALFGFLIGILVTLMNDVNARLSQFIGGDAAVTFIHLTGLLAILPFGLRKARSKAPVPLWAWSGGLVGILTIIFSNIAFSNLNMTLATAAVLSGQAFSSLWFDHIGLFGYPKVAFDRRRVISLFFILLGTAVMVLW